MTNLILPTTDGTFPSILLEVILIQLRRMAILVMRLTTFSAFDDKARRAIVGRLLTQATRHITTLWIPHDASFAVSLHFLLAFDTYARIENEATEDTPPLSPPLGKESFW